MEKTDIWMPVYIGDYVADTMHLTTEQHGAYFLLLMHYWRKGPLPADPQLVAPIARLSGQSWTDCWQVIECFFPVASDGLRHNKRADIEIIAALEIKKRQSEKGKKGASSRWQKDHPESAKKCPEDGTGNATDNGAGNARAMAQGMAGRWPEPWSDDGPPPSPLPIPKPLPKPAEEKRSRPAEPDPASAASCEVAFNGEGKVLDEREAVRRVFNYYRKETGKTDNYVLTNARMQKGLNRLKELRVLYGSNAVRAFGNAVSALVTSDWHMGRDPRSEGRKYCDWIDNLAKSQEQVNKWLEIYFQAHPEQFQEWTHKTLTQAHQ